MGDPSNYRYLAQLGEMIEYLEGLLDYGGLSIDEYEHAFLGKERLLNLKNLMSDRLDRE